MASKNTLNVETLSAQSADAIAVFFPDLSTAARLSLPAGQPVAFPPSDVGGCWYISVPVGKTVWLIGTEPSEAELANVALLSERVWPITGPIHYPVAMHQGDSYFLVASSGAFDVHVVRQRNEGASA